jgi:hypothetical protein
MLIYPTLDNKKNIKSDFLEDTIMDMLVPTFVIPKNYSYELYQVEEKYIARPDLISYDIYGDTMFGDLICKLNGISNPFELNKDMILVLPSPDSIMDFIYIPSAGDLDDSWGVVGTSNVDKNVKTKASKRQANEAILGDARFKIDKTSKVIIY